MRTTAFVSSRHALIVACCLVAHGLGAQTPGGAVCLDGIDDFVQPSPIGWLTTLSNVQNSFTIEMWVKPNASRVTTAESVSGLSGTNSQRFAVFPDDANALYLDTNHASAGLSIGTNGISIFERTGTNYFPSPLVYNPFTPLTNWTHVALVYQSRQPRLYVNGTLVRNGITGVKVVHPSLNFGGGGSFGHFAGCIDEVRVWSVTRTGQEISLNRFGHVAVPQANLIGYWRFDELSGTTSTNLADPALNSTLMNGVTREDSGALFRPVATTIGASNVTATTAEIYGEVTPNNSSTLATLRYGLNTSVLTLGVNTNVGSGLVPVPVMASLGGLQPGALYYFRQDASGVTSVTGELLTFQTDPLPPEAFTLAASSITPTSAVLNSSITANGLETTAWFQWGLTTTNLDNISETFAVGGGGVGISVQLPLSNLVAGLNYYYRIFATNELGATNGFLSSFTTPLFTQFTVPLNGLIDGQLAWGDYNGDQRLDLVMTGTDAGSFPRTILLTNSGTSFTTSLSLTGMTESAVGWSDYDGDGDLDLAVAGRSNQSGGARPLALLFHNSGTGFIVTNPFPFSYQSALAWGDYDNDGRQDMLMAGSGDTSTNTWLLRNTPAGFIDVGAPFPGVVKGALAWGDYDNDGWLDVAIAGNHPTGRLFQVWRNVRGSLTNIGADLPGLIDASVAWGDFDNDGLLDLAFTGTSLTNLHCDVWRNTGSGFTHFAALTKVTFGSVSWGDYDNDGWLDLLLTGLASSVPVTDLFRNDGGTNFIKIAKQIAPLTSVQRSSGEWGDFDNDGRLDVAVLGIDGTSVRQIDVWRSHTPLTNTPPGAPSNLVATLLGANSALLTWDAATDAQTPATGLSYNVSIGTTPGGNQVMPSLALSNGFRLVPANGTLRRQPFAIVTNVTWGKGPFYWSVQAVDSALAGGPFAHSVLVGPPDVLTWPASNVGSNSATVNATVNPGNIATVAWFQYGLTPGFGESTSPTNLTGGMPVPISADLTNLFLGATYFFRAVATNLGGVSYGEKFTFTPAVPPEPFTLAADGFTTNFNAAIHGTVSPGGIPTTVFFEYGLTTGYGNTTPVMNVGNGTNAVPVTAALSGLSLGGLYHYRTVSSNALGVTYGPDVTFGVNLIPGDLNFDGEVSLEELNFIIQYYRRLLP